MKGKKDTSTCHLKGDFNNKTSDVCYSYLEFTLKFSYLKFQHMYGGGGGRKPFSPNFIIGYTECLNHIHHERESIYVTELDLENI